MAKIQTYSTLTEAAAILGTDAEFVRRQLNLHRIRFVTTANGCLIHSSELKRFASMYKNLLRIAQVENECAQIAKTQMQFEFSDLIHDLEGK